LLTVPTLPTVRCLSAAELILIIRVPVRPSRAKVISMPMFRRNVRSRPKKRIDFASRGKMRVLPTGIRLFFRLRELFYV
jgi:hypothetical protein